MATVTYLPPLPAEPAPWDVNDATVIKLAASQLRHGVTPAEALQAASLCPEYRPVAEAMERLETAEDVADVSRDMIRAASRR